MIVFLPLCKIRRICTVNIIPSFVSLSKIFLIQSAVCPPFNIRYFDTCFCWFQVHLAEHPTPFRFAVDHRKYINNQNVTLPYKSNCSSVYITTKPAINSQQINVVFEITAREEGVGSWELSHDADLKRTYTTLLKSGHKKTKVQAIFTMESLYILQTRNQITSMRPQFRLQVRFY